MSTQSDSNSNSTLASMRETLEGMKENIKQGTENLKESAQEKLTTFEKNAFLAYDDASRMLKPESQKTVGEKATDMAHGAIDNARLLGVMGYYKAEEAIDNIKKEVKEADRNATAKTETTHVASTDHSDFTTSTHDNSTVDKMKEGVLQGAENLKEGAQETWDSVKKNAFLAYDNASRALKPEDDKTTGEKATDMAHNAVDNTRLVGLKAYDTMDNASHGVGATDRVTEFSTVPEFYVAPQFYTAPQPTSAPQPTTAPQFSTAPLSSGAPQFSTAPQGASVIVDHKDSMEIMKETSEMLKEGAVEVWDTIKKTAIVAFDAAANVIIPEDDKTVDKKAVVMVPNSTADTVPDVRMSAQHTDVDHDDTMGKLKEEVIQGAEMLKEGAVEAWDTIKKTAFVAYDAAAHVIHPADESNATVVAPNDTVDTGFVATSSTSTQNGGNDTIEKLKVEVIHGAEVLKEGAVEAWDSIKKTATVAYDAASHAIIPEEKEKITVTTHNNVPPTVVVITPSDAPFFDATVPAKSSHVSDNDTMEKLKVEVIHGAEILKEGAVEAWDSIKKTATIAYDVASHAIIPEEKPTGANAVDNTRSVGVQAQSITVVPSDNIGVVHRQAVVNTNNMTNTGFAADSGFTDRLGARDTIRNDSVDHDDSMERLKEDVIQGAEMLKEGAVEAWDSVKKNAQIAYDAASRALKAEDEKPLVAGAKPVDVSHGAAYTTLLTGPEVYEMEVIKVHTDGTEGQAIANKPANTGFVADGSVGPSTYEVGKMDLYT
jgi:predicted ribosome-associated RNA-binding protein Tma20